MQELKQKRDELNAEVKKLILQKKKLIQKIIETKSTINEEKKKRDEENRKVAECKEKRQEKLAQAKEYRNNLEKILEKIETLESSVTGSYNFLKKNLEELDWEYQTGVHSIKKERQMVKEMDELERQLLKSKELFDQKKEIYSLQKNLKNAYAESNIYHKLVLGHAKQSEASHKKIIELYEKVRETFNSVKELDGKIDKTKKEADELHAEYIKEKEKAGELSFQGKKKAELEEIEKAAEIGKELRKKAEKILADFKNGKKITAEELKLLQEFGLF